MDRASQTEAVLQKKDLLSSSVSTNSVEIDNPVPQEGGLEKVSASWLLLTLRCADQQRDATHELVRDRFRSLFRCHAIVVAREPLNGGGFHLIAGVWKTSARPKAPRLLIPLKQQRDRTGTGKRQDLLCRKSKKLRSSSYSSTKRKP